MTKTAKKDRFIEEAYSEASERPKADDVVYQVLEDVFQSKSDHVLTRDMQVRHRIKRLPFRRFMLGHPPRKQNDTSTGDALNFEWIVHCGKTFPGKLIIVSRDSDYSLAVNDQNFLNNQLGQEFRDRAGQKSFCTLICTLNGCLMR